VVKLFLVSTGKGLDRARGT